MRQMQSAIRIFITRGVQEIPDSPPGVAPPTGSAARIAGRPHDARAWWEDHGDAVRARRGERATHDRLAATMAVDLAQR